MAIEQPLLGSLLEQLRNQAAPGGKKMSRVKFAELLGMTPTQIHNIERGRKLKPGELEKITAVYPQLGTGEVQGLLIQDVHLADTTGKQGPQTIAYGDLVALDEELEDPEEQEAPRQQALIPVSEVVTRPTMHFSNSEIQTFKRCRRKWYLAWYRQLKLRAEDPVGALAIGNRVHRALQAWYVPEGETPTDPRTALEAAIRDDWEACKQAYAQRGAEPSPELIKEFNENTALERAMVEGYMEWLIETGVDSGLRVIASETYLEAPLDVPGVEVEVKLIGKIDVRVVREIDGARLFIDHKTTGSLTEPLKTIRLDPQMLHYHVLEWLSDIDGARCDGALYNMLKKVKRTARANPPFFDRVEVRHNLKELEAFKKQLIGVIRTMIETRARLDNGEDPTVVAYPTPNKQCGWDCDFLPVCPMFDDGSRVEDMLHHHYVVGDPYSHYREKEGE